MTSKEFVKRLKDTAALHTYYIKGGFGLVLDAKGKERVIKSYKYNADRADKIRALPDAEYFAFDCCGLIKGIIWGFIGDHNQIYGGATYKSNGLDDLGEKGLLGICNNISDDFNNIKEGEFLYMPGHCGIYIGNNKVCESTPAGACGVQITDIKRCKWKAHGELPCIDYNVNGNIVKPVIPSFYLKQGSRGMNVYNLQRCLNFLGANLVTDGVFGPKTKQALVNFQKKYKLLVDGIYGPQSQKKLREVIG